LNTTCVDDAVGVLDVALPGVLAVLALDAATRADFADGLDGVGVLEDVHVVAGEELIAVVLQLGVQLLPLAELLA
jgi:hypothetical protein